MKKITLISDTHGKHNEITNDLIGGDILIHSGDIMTNGYYSKELHSFCKWFQKIDNYTYKIFIAGNHDRIFENDPILAKYIINQYPNIIYLQDDFINCSGIRIYGSPWQPEFYNWAFNLPRNGKKLEEKWSWIPKDLDVLITHGPAYGYVDQIENKQEHLGCEKLIKRIEKTKPKIHVCGHIHSGYGQDTNEITKFYNASVLDETYNYNYKPINLVL